MTTKEAMEGVNAIKTILAGGTASVSRGQLAYVLVNLIDAKANLPDDQFNRVKGVMDTLLEETDGIVMNAKELRIAAGSVMRLFNHFAPYEKYCGDAPSSFPELFEPVNGIPPLPNTPTNNSNGCAMGIAQIVVWLIVAGGFVFLLMKLFG